MDGTRAIKKSIVEAAHLVPPSGVFVNPSTMSDTDNTLTKESSTQPADANTVTAEAIEDVKSRILHGRQLALVIAYAHYLVSVSCSTDIH